MKNQKADDEKIIQKAKQRASQTGEPVALYRDEQGRLCIAAGPGYPIIIIITPDMR